MTENTTNPNDPNDLNKRPLVVLTGPTAVGKTELSIRLAHAVEGEILSADSMQVYKGMDIGSAKITREQMRGVKHHLIDIMEPWEEFNVVAFQTRCRECLREIYERGHIPILTGGTGFYIQAVLRDIDFTENEENTEYRVYLEDLARERGASYLHGLLEKVDPKGAQAIHQNNIKRTIRALEFYHLTGTRISDHNRAEMEKGNAFNACYFVLTDDRQRLYQRIDERVDIMLKQGLVEEVRGLIKAGCTRDMAAMQGLGYKEIIDYLEGRCSLEEAVCIIKRDTRHFAKRQLTWFRREKEVIWLDRCRFEDDDRILEYMLEMLQKKNIIDTQEV